MLEHSSEPDLSHMSPGPFVQSPLPKTPVAVRLNSAVKNAVKISRAQSKIPYFQRRIAVAVLFTTRYKSNPDPASWGRIAKEISELLDIPKNSRSGVIANIKTVAKLGGDLSQFNVNAGTSQRRKGRFLIKDGSPEAGVLIRGLESGLLKNGALSWVNYLRHDLGEPPVSRFAVTMFIARYQSKQVMKRLRRGKTKSGSTQPDSDWAQARLCFVDQLLSAFANGELAIEQVVFADEIIKTVNWALFQNMKLLCVATVTATSSPSLREVFGRNDIRLLHRRTRNKRVVCLLSQCEDSHRSPSHRRCLLRFHWLSQTLDQLPSHRP